MPPRPPPTHRATTAILDVLPRAARAGLTGQDPSDNLLIGDTQVLVRWAGEGQLGDVLPLLRAGLPAPAIVAARRLSPGARHALTAAGVGWVDESGAAEIAFGSVIVSRSGRPAVPERRTGWTSAVLAVAEALLTGTKPTVEAVLHSTGLSMGSGTTALRVLTDLGLLASAAKRGRQSGRQVVDPRQLLAAYASAAEAIRSPLALQVGVTWREPVAGLTQLGARWTQDGVAWAATGAVAASVLAPHLTSFGSVEVYVAPSTVLGIEALAAEAGLRPIEGGRLTLRPFPTVAVPRLATTLDGLVVSPWPRIVADLRGAGVRGEEAAEHLAEVMLGR